MEKAKATIQGLREAVQAAKDAQKEAKAECTKLERDMDEFKNNKDGKIDELKASISAQKVAHQKHNVVLKTQQKELQGATLELGARIPRFFVHCKGLLMMCIGVQLPV